jgi:hypothetical protein
MTRSITTFALLALASPAIAQPTDPEPDDGAPAPTDPAPVAEPPPPEPAPERAPSPATVTDAVDAPPTPRATRLTVAGEIFTTAAATRTEGDSLSAFDVPRAEIGAELGFGRSLLAAVRVEAVRSAADQSTVGIDGNSLVLRVKRAFVAGTTRLGSVDLRGDAGLIADPWIAAIEDGYPLRALAATASEGLLAWDTGDLGASLSGAVGPIRVAVAAGNGEGRRQMELNDGKNVTGLLDAKVLDIDAATIHVLAVARDGSLGPSQARDQRFGGGLVARTKFGRAGVEVVRALGLHGRGEVEATAVAGWIAAPVYWRVGVAGRVAMLDVAGAESASTTLTGAATIDLVDSASGSVRGFLAVERENDVMTLPGTNAADATRILGVLSATGWVGMP